ncbi:GYF domain-containing protein [Stenotrophomonas humi]
MSQWFYAEGNRERRGPVPGQEVAALFRAGQLSADTLIWREGIGDWQPLRNVAGELGLHELLPPSTALPPGVPPLPPPLQTLPRSRPAIPTHKPAASGWVVFGAIAAAVGLALLSIGGVLAAVAIPAYHQYVLRSRIAAVEVQLAPLKDQITTFVMRNERCPNNGDAGFDSPESYAADGIALVYIGDFKNDHCGLEARLHMPDQQPLDGKSLWLDYDTQSATWECSSDVADKHLPPGCRG